MRFLKLDYVFAPLSVSVCVSVCLYPSPPPPAPPPLSIFLSLSFARVRGGRVRNSIFYVFYYWFNSFSFE